MKLFIVCSLDEKEEKNPYAQLRFLICFDNKKEAKSYLNLFMPRQYFIIKVRGKSFLSRARMHQNDGWKGMKK